MNGVINQVITDKYALYNGDSTEVLNNFPDESIHLSVFSPPFNSLYVYSNSERDLGNCKTTQEFYEHLGFIVEELYRVTKPGRISACHCMNIPAMKERDGYIGLKDFRGDLIRLFQSKGFIFHSEHCIWKDPLLEAVRTKALGLMHKQLCKDSCMSRAGIPDYLLGFRKPGGNEEFVSHIEGLTEFHGEDEPISGVLSHERWRRYASPVWMDIRMTNTLQYMAARDTEDERHICLARGSLVLTSEGHKPIQDVCEGDLVLTHKGRWMPVMVVKKTGFKPVITVKAQGVPGLTLTPDHKLWSRIVPENAWSQAHSKASAKKIEPSWNEAQKTLGGYVNQKTLPEINLNIDETELWLIGRWIADGHRDSRDKCFSVSIGNHKLEYFKEKAKGFCGAETSLTAIQIRLINLSKSTRNLLYKCGKGAINKQIPIELLSLNNYQSKILMDGYLSGDGHFSEKTNMWMATTISRKLALGLSILIQKAYGVITSVFKGRKAGNTIIEGRTVNTNQEYILSFCMNSKKIKPFIENDGAWKKVRAIELSGEAETWCLKVAEDESFHAEGCIVKNCPMSLDISRRAIQLWSNPGDVVLTPFMGIGSEVYSAVELGRMGIGIELKESYFRQSTKNIKTLDAPKQGELF